MDWVAVAGLSLEPGAAARGSSQPNASPFRERTSKKCPMNYWKLLLSSVAMTVLAVPVSAQAQGLPTEPGLHAGLDAGNEAGLKQRFADTGSLLACAMLLRAPPS